MKNLAQLLTNRFSLTTAELSRGKLKVRIANDDPQVRKLGTNLIGSGEPIDPRST